MCMFFFATLYILWPGPGFLFPGLFQFARNPYTWFQMIFVATAFVSFAKGCKGLHATHLTAVHSSWMSTLMIADVLCSLCGWKQCRVIHKVGLRKHAVMRHVHSTQKANMHACNFHACAQDIILSHWKMSCLAAMEADQIARCKGTMTDNGMQPYAKLPKLVSDLKAAGLCHRRTLRPCDLIIHPHNRGASMANPHDFRERGARNEKIGIRQSLLTDSFCIEVNPEEPARTSQLQANKKLVASSEGLLQKSCLHEFVHLRARTTSSSVPGSFAAKAGNG